MELVIPTVIYLLILSFMIVRMTGVLFGSKSPAIRGIAYAATAIFVACLLWEVILFIRNEDGKSFTVGWFALAYFLLVAFTVFALAAFLLRLVEKRILRGM